MIKLGKLQRVDDLRATWIDEAKNFTPWLALPENLSILSEYLGLGPEGLELESVEKLVGPYRADILWRSTVSGDWVLIENQLEKTDHNHLGQILVYAAGLGAKTIVWISKHVTSEHKAAVEWLNEISDGGPSFFAFEIELWKIGASELAPRFNLVVSPNNWTRSAATAKKSLEVGGLSDLRTTQLKYWEEFEGKLGSTQKVLRPVKPQPQSWMAHGIGKTGVSLNATSNFKNRWIRAELYLGGKTAWHYYGMLISQRAEIDAEFGFPLEWYDGAEMDRRIYIELKNVDPYDKSKWSDQHQWLIDNLVRLHRVFHDRVSKLGPDTVGLA